mmetsp:Transcript_12089/g.24622  ORF Transcript_12089/g.24622 Transcript_12089/m.24622 type:complete len:80 (+) Transcript_12089:142-381(+)
MRNRGCFSHLTYEAREYWKGKLREEVWYERLQSRIRLHFLTEEVRRANDTLLVKLNFSEYMKSCGGHARPSFDTMIEDM